MAEITKYPDLALTKITNIRTVEELVNNLEKIEPVYNKLSLAFFNNYNFVSIKAEELKTALSGLPRSVTSVDLSGNYLNTEDKVIENAIITIISKTKIRHVYFGEGVFVPETIIQELAKNAGKNRIDVLRE